MNTTFVKLIFCRFDFTCWGNTTFNFTCFCNDISVHVLSTIICLKGGWKEIRGIWLQRNARLPLSRLTGFSNTEKRFFSMSSPNVFAGLVSAVFGWLGLVVIWSLFPSFYFIFILLYHFFQKKILEKIFPKSSIEKKNLRTHFPSSSHRKLLSLSTREAQAKQCRYIRRIFYRNGST